MPSPPCPVCDGPTLEIRAKLVCRRCGTIIETCCEGGPMGGCPGAPTDAADEPAAPPARPESPDVFPRD